MALHRVGCAGQQACTLHIYNRPIDKCRIYCPDTGRVEERISGYFTLSDRVMASLGDNPVSKIHEVLTKPPTFSFMDFLPVLCDSRSKNPN